MMEDRGAGRGAGRGADQGVDRGPVMACMACGNRIVDADQRTCPHCLAPLRVRRFGHDAAYRDFLEDRRAHGAHVEPVRKAPRRGLALALLFSATILLLGATTVLVAGFGNGLNESTLSAVTTAVVPFGIGLGLLEVSRRMGGFAR